MIDLCLFNHDARSWVGPQCQFKLAFTLNYKILSNFRFKIHLHWKLKLACHVWKHPQKEQIQDCQTQELLSQSIAKRLGLGKRGLCRTFMLEYNQSNPFCLNHEKFVFHRRHRHIFQIQVCNNHELQGQDGLKWRGGGLVKRTNCILKTSNVIILATCTGTCACTCNIFMQASWQIVDSQMFRHFYVPKNGSKNMKLARYKNIFFIHYLFLQLFLYMKLYS